MHTEYPVMSGSPAFCVGAAQVTLMVDAEVRWAVTAVGGVIGGSQMVDVPAGTMKSTPAAVY